MKNKVYYGIERKINSSDANLGINPKGFDSALGVLSEEKDIVDGIMVKKSTVKYSCPSESIKGFRVNDFSIENLSEIGAIDGLKPVQFNDVDVDTFTNQLDDLVDNM